MQLNPGDTKTIVDSSLQITLSSINLPNLEVFGLSDGTDLNLPIWHINSSSPIQSFPDGASFLSSISPNSSHFLLHLDLIPLSIQKIVFSISDDRQPLSPLNTIDVRFTSRGIPVANLSTHSSQRLSSFIICEVYRRNNQWRVRNVSQGFSQGRHQLLKYLRIDEKNRYSSAPSSINIDSTNDPAPLLANQQQLMTQSSTSEGQRFRATARSPGFVLNPYQTHPDPIIGNITMSFLNQIKSTFNNTRQELTTQVSRYKNKKFMEATVAVCSIMAMGNGTIKPEEKQKMIGYIRQSSELKVFSTEEVISVFTSLIDQFQFDYDIGKGEAIKKILALKDFPDQAQLAVRVGIAVARSDGDFDDEEKRLAAYIINALDLDPSSFDVA